MSLSEEKARALLASTQYVLTAAVARLMLRGGPWGLWAWNQLTDDARCSIDLSSSNAPAHLHNLTFHYAANSTEDDTPAAAPRRGHPQVPAVLRGVVLNAAQLAGSDLACVDLRRAKLHKAALRGANLRGAKLDFAELIGAKMEGATLESASLRGTNLAGARLFGARLQGASLNGAHLSGAELCGLEWSRTTTVQGIKVDAETLRPAPTFRRHIDDTHFIDELCGAHPKWGRLWQATSDYGRSLGRWAIWSFCVALFFGIIYSPTPGFMSDGLSKMHLEWLPNVSFKQGFNSWFSPFYFSIVTFTTLGFGDFTPGNLFTELLVVIEVTFGYVMLGGLISIFANKLARRS